jgi:hypothetical protein
MDEVEDLSRDMQEVTPAVLATLSRLCSAGVSDQGYPLIDKRLALAGLVGAFSELLARDMDDLSDADIVGIAHGFADAIVEAVMRVRRARPGARN